MWCQQTDFTLKFCKVTDEYASGHKEEVLILCMTRMLLSRYQENTLDAFSMLKAIYRQKVRKTKVVSVMK